MIDKKHIGKKIMFSKLQAPTIDEAYSISLEKKCIYIHAPRRNVIIGYDDLDNLIKALNLTKKLLGRNE